MRNQNRDPIPKSLIKTSMLLAGAIVLLASCGPQPESGGASDAGPDVLAPIGAAGSADLAEPRAAQAARVE